MEALILKIVLSGFALFGGAHLLENKLENYVMDKVPDWAKGLVVPAISTIFAIIASVQGGVDPWVATLTALGFAGYVDKVHNNPATTTADIGPPPELP